MTNAPILTADDFSEDEWELLERAAKGKAPADWLRAIALELAATIVEGEADNDGDEDIALEGAQEPQGGREDIEGSVIAGGVDAVILERLDRLESTMQEMRSLAQEMCFWAQTLLSEVYAHTGFASEAAEKAARAKAIVKFKEIEESVKALLKRANGTTH